MDEQIRQIAQRLQGLRDALDLTAADVAAECAIPLEEYRKAESGTSDISLSI